MEHDNKPGIPVVFATDDNYVSYLSVAIQSIIENCKSNISIYVFYVDLNQELILFLKEQVNPYNNINITFVNCKEEISLLNLDSGGVQHLNSIAWLRLLIPYILDQYNKVIYLDVDLLVLEDLSELYNIELEDNLIAAARDTFIVSWDNQDCIKNKLDVPDNYYNSGVLLFNSLEFRKRYTKDKLLQMAYSSNYYYADQDFLNLLTDGNTVLLSSKWNMQKGWLSSYSPNWLVEEYEYAQSNPNIVHFIHKPMKETVISDLSILFLDYASKVKVTTVNSLFINAHISGIFIYENTIRDYILNLIKKDSEKMDLRFLIKCVLLKLFSLFKRINNW